MHRQELNVNNNPYRPCHEFNKLQGEAALVGAVKYDPILACLDHRSLQVSSGLNMDNQSLFEVPPASNMGTGSPSSRSSQVTPDHDPPVHDMDSRASLLKVQENPVYFS
jgi:hypothetical protein